MSFRGKRNFRRTRTMGNIVQSVKNCFEVKITAAAGAIQNNAVAKAVEVGVATKVTGIEVPVGAKVFSIEVWQGFVGQTGTVTAVVEWFIGKAREGQTFSSFPDPDFTAVGLSGRRNQIWHQEQSLTGTENASPYKFHRRIKVPKIYQRMRADDNIFISFKSDIIGQYLLGVIYKYYM